MPDDSSPGHRSQSRPTRGRAPQRLRRPGNAPSMLAKLFPNSRALSNNKLKLCSDCRVMGMSRVHVHFFLGRPPGASRPSAWSASYHDWRPSGAGLSQLIILSTTLLARSLCLLFSLSLVHSCSIYFMFYYISFYFLLVTVYAATLEIYAVRYTEGYVKYECIFIQSHFFNLPSLLSYCV